MSSTNIAIKSGNGYKLIKDLSIVYCSASGSYTEIILDTGETFTVSKKLKELESVLPINFLRVHRSHLVNINHVKEITNDKGIFLILTNENKVPITKEKKKILVQHYKTI